MVIYVRISSACERPDFLFYPFLHQTEHSHVSSSSRVLCIADVDQLRGPRRRERPVPRCQRGEPIRDRTPSRRVTFSGLRKKSWGQIPPNTATVEEGYQWFDVAAWPPEADQYLWVGPGPFTKDGGQSAIEAVYVDRFELTRVE